MILNPHYQELGDWADSFSYFYESRGIPVERLDDITKWREWAAGIKRSATQLGQDAPNPYDFEDWREWASRVFQMVELTG